MPQATVAKAGSRTLNARELSRLQPRRAVKGPLPDEVPDPKFMQFLGEYGALPIDLAARLVCCPIEEIEQMIVLGVKLGWMRYREFPLEQEEGWALLRGGAKKQVDKQTKSRLSPAHLSHRREVIEAHLLFREEKPGWSWTCEGALHHHDNTGLAIPDGVLKRRSKRWAIEVERTMKALEALHKKLKALCAEYDKVVYFGTPHVRNKLAQLLSAGDYDKLEMRPLPGEDSSPTKRVSQRGDYEPSPRARRVLRLINEDGLLCEEQMPRLLGWEPGEVAEALEELDGEGCILRNERQYSQGWVRCSQRGARRSETDLAGLLNLPGRGAFVKRLVLTEVRLDVLRRWPEASWVTRRLLEKGHDSKPAGIPRAAVDRGGLRYAVIVVEARPDAKLLVKHLKQVKKGYAGVLCYRAARTSEWLERLLKGHNLDWVEVRELPKPPPSASYQTLEDEWRTGREPYRPVGYEASLLWLINTEGLISELQLPRLLGCSPEAAERLIAPLLEHECLERKDGWLCCTRRGTKLSSTDISRAHVPKEGYLEQCFQLMEVRLSDSEPVSLETWKTRRQIGVEKRAEGVKAPTNRHPDAAVLVDGQWRAIALIPRGFRRRSQEAQLLRWATEYGALRCYCPAEDVEPLRGLLKRCELPSVEVYGLPTAPEGPARVRQQAFEAGLITERERREARDHHKFQAQKAVAKAVSTGDLKKPDRCESCSKKIPKAKLQGHHEDYSKPLDVKWLCVKCHAPQDQARRECEARTKGAAKPDPRRSRRSPKPRAKSAR